MKYLIILFLTMSAMANYIPETKVGAKTNLTVFMKKQKCESHYSENCIQIPFGYNSEFNVTVDEMVNDYTLPNYETKSSVVNCLDEADCIEKELAQVCDRLNGYFKVRLEDNSEVYCTKIVSYAQKLSGRKIVVTNQSKKDSYESAKLASEQFEQGIQMAMKRIDHGKRIIALIIVRNAPKALNKGQIKQMNSTYAEIKGLLETGSLETAVDEINLITPDGIIVTADDKISLVAEINKFLAL